MKKDAQITKADFEEVGIRIDTVESGIAARFVTIIEATMTEQYYIWW